METLTYLVMLVVGLGTASAAFFRDLKMRGAFSKGPGVPVSRVGRVILFIGGGLVAIEGVRRLLGKPPFEIDLTRWLSG